MKGGEGGLSSQFLLVTGVMGEEGGKVSRGRIGMTLKHQSGRKGRKMGPPEQGLKQKGKLCRD